MNSNDFIYCFVSALKKSLRPKNLMLFLILGFIAWDGIRFILVKFLIPSVTFVGEELGMITGVSEIVRYYSNFIPDIIVITLPIVLPLLILIFMSTIIRNTKEEKLKENLIFSIKKLPRLAALSIVIILIFATINFSFNWLSVSSLKERFGTIASAEQTKGLFEGVSLPTYEGMSPPTVLYGGAILFSLLITPENILSSILTLLATFVFFFLFQEAIIADRGIKDSLKNSFRLFKENYLSIAIVWILFSLVNFFIILMLSNLLYPVTLQLIGGLGIEMTIVLLIYLLCISWSFLFQIILITEVYLKIRK